MSMTFESNYRAINHKEKSSEKPYLGSPSSLLNGDCEVSITNRKKRKCVCSKTTQLPRKKELSKEETGGMEKML